MDFSSVANTILVRFNTVENMNDISAHDHVHAHIDNGLLIALSTLDVGLLKRAATVDTRKNKLVYLNSVSWILNERDSADRGKKNLNKVRILDHTLLYKDFVLFYNEVNNHTTV